LKTPAPQGRKTNFGRTPLLHFRLNQHNLIPDTSLLVIAEVEAAEVISHVKRQSFFNGAGLALISVISGWVVLVGQRKRQFVLKRRLEHSESRRRELQTRLNSIVKSSTDAIIWTDQHGNVLAANDRAFELYGRSLDELQRATFQELFPPEMRGVFNDIIQQIADRGSHSCEIRQLRKDGSNFPAQAQGCLVNVGESGKRLFVFFVRDLTEEKRAEAERKQLEEMFQQSQKFESLGRLAGSIAHDFNNSLNVILGYASLLHDNLPENNRLKRYCEQVISAAEEAVKLTRQLLIFSRKQPIERKLINLNDVIRDSCDWLSRVVGERISIKTCFGPDVGLVQADASLLHQMLLNLATNARDAMPEGGTLAIETSCEDVSEEYQLNHPDASCGRYAVLTVRDTGIGMDSETLQHLFEPFFTTKEKGKGTGLGLASIYATVKQHGGRIFVHSEPHNGTTFKIYFPQATQEEESLVA